MLPQRALNEIMLPQRALNETMLPQRALNETMLPQRALNEIMLPQRALNETMLPQRALNEIMLPMKKKKETKSFTTSHSQHRAPPILPLSPPQGSTNTHPVSTTGMEWGHEKKKRGQIGSKKQSKKNRKELSIKMKLNKLN